MCAVHKRQLREPTTQEYVAAAQRSSPTFVYMEKMADTDPGALTAGNITVPRTQQIITQAVYDSRKDKHLSEDMYHELEIMNDTFRSSVRKKVKEYIQGLGGVPFWTLFYREEQLECFRDICRSGSAGGISTQQAA